MKQKARRAAYRKEVKRLTNEHHPPRWPATREHHVPISFGFNRGIPAELIGSPANISYVDIDDNLAKSTMLDDRGRQNLIQWGYDYLVK